MEKVNLVINKDLIDICKEISKTDDDITVICNKYKTSYHILYKKAIVDVEFRDVLEGALVDRALLFFEKSRKIVDSIEWKWTTTYVDRKGTHDVVKERMSAASIAKIKVDYYMKACELLAPMVFGSKSKELKEVQKGILELSLQLASKIPSKDQFTTDCDII